MITDKCFHYGKESTVHSHDWVTDFLKSFSFGQKLRKKQPEYWKPVLYIKSLVDTKQNKNKPKRRGQGKILKKKKGKDREKGHNGSRLIAPPQPPLWSRPRAPCPPPPKELLLASQLLSRHYHFLPDPVFSLSSISFSHSSNFEFLCVLGVKEADGRQLLLGPLAGEVGVGSPDPGAVTARVRLQLHHRRDAVVGAGLEGLVPAHEEADGPLLLVLQQLDVPGAQLLPLREVVLRSETEQLGPHLKKLLFIFFQRFNFLLRKRNYGLKLGVMVGLVGILGGGVVLLVGVLGGRHGRGGGGGSAGSVVAGSAASRRPVAAPASASGAGASRPPALPSAPRPKPRPLTPAAGNAPPRVTLMLTKLQ